MNAVEIEQAITDLADRPFDASSFAYDFLEAFGNKETTLKRLRAGASNKSDLGGVLQTNNIHIATCDEGAVSQTLGALRESKATAKAKAKFILATDGSELQADDLVGGDTIACAYKDFPDHFGFFLPLAGITTVRQIKENAFDIRATSRLNRLYVELLRDNPDWGRGDQRPEMNHFMARLVFCFFAEDTNIFTGTRLFTTTVAQMSAKDSSNTHEVIEALFLAMNTKGGDDRAASRVPRWADAFPYVNGGLFSGSLGVPRFSKIARSYLLHVGGLDWTKINPDIFGSMIQAVAEDEERGELGMHYTSVPNILKVLNPLFLDDLRARLTEAGDNARMLLNLRKRLARIRVFDPACGSGNFLVIAYKEMRAIEAEVNGRRGEADRRSEIPLTNFRGIELRDFPAEIARLALVIAEYQCDVLHRGQKLALAEFLPLRNENWIVCDNALRLDWLAICPPTGTGVKFLADDLFGTPLDQPEIDFENEGGETYICGNPPYLGSRRQDETHKEELRVVASSQESKWRSLDYASAWLFRAKEFQDRVGCAFAFVTTSSLCEGLHVSILWPHIVSKGSRIFFAHRPFKWRNLAKGNAGVSVVVVGVTNLPSPTEARIFEDSEQHLAKYINAYLVSGPEIYVATRAKQIASQPLMLTGAMPRDGGHLILSADERNELIARTPRARDFLRRYLGSDELINGKIRFCVWVGDDEAEAAALLAELGQRFEQVRVNRERSPLQSTKDAAASPHRFVYLADTSTVMTVAIGAVSSENRAYLPVDCLAPDVVCSNRVYAIYDGSLADLAILSSRLHLTWAAAVCGRLEQRLSYSNTLGWNTFPVPTLTDKNKADLVRCGEGILLAREHHFPSTIADLYDPETMPADLRAAHDRNDEVLERIYVGRRFKNDTERLEKLFDLYTKMTAAAAPKAKKPRAGAST